MTRRRRSRRLTLDAKPEPMEIDTAETALIVIDMQNDFAAKGGLVDRLGFDIAPIRKTIGPMTTALAAARAAGIPIVYLKMGFRPDLSDVFGAENVQLYKKSAGMIAVDRIASTSLAFPIRSDHT